MRKEQTACAARPKEKAPPGRRGRDREAYRRPSIVTVSCDAPMTAARFFPGYRRAPRGTTTTRSTKRKRLKGSPARQPSPSGDPLGAMCVGFLPCSQRRGRPTSPGGDWSSSGRAHFHKTDTCRQAPGAKPRRQATGAAEAERPYGAADRQAGRCSIADGAPNL